MDSIISAAAGILVFLLSILLLSKLLSVAVAATMKHGKKNLPPSPPSLPIIGHLHLLRTPLHRSLAKLASLHGPVMSLRLGSRPVLIVSSASAAEECFTTNDVAFANRPRLLVAKYSAGDLAWSSYGSHWRNLRRIFALEILSSHRIQSFSGVRMEEVKYLVSRLHQDCGQQDFKKVELRRRFYGLVFNMTMRAVLGKSYYGDDVESDEEAMKFERLMEDAFVLAGAVALADYLPWLRWMDFKGIEKKMAEWKMRAHAFMGARIKERRAMRTSRSGGDEKGRPNVLDVFLKLREEQPEYFNDNVVIGSVTNILLAGTDTTMVTLEWAMSLLLNHPTTMEKVREEVNSCVGTSKMLEESDIPRLPYLKAIINETLRLHPPGPLLAPHESSKDTVVGGYDIPGGTMLLVNAWAIQRDEKVWEDADEFKPERFLPEKDGGDATLEGCKSIPFGYGRRRCPGEALAMKELWLVLGTLIQCFEWEKVGGVEVGMEEGVGLSIPKAVPLEVMCRTRKGMLPFLS